MVTRGTVPTTRVVIKIIIIVIISGGIQADVTCEAFITDDETNVTCFFGHNINKSQHNFNVFYYPENSTDSAESTLICNWRTSKTLVCSKSPNVHFNHVVSDRLTLTKPAAGDKVRGFYVCQTVPKLPSSTVHICPLKFRASPTTPAPPPPQPQLPATARPSYPSSGYGRQRDHTEDINVATLLLLCILILCIVIVIVSFILYKKRQRIMKWWRSKTNRGSGPTDTEDTAESSSLCDIENIGEFLLKRKDNQYLSTLDSLAAFLYNKGWREALQAHGIKTEMAGDVGKTAQNPLLTDPGYSDDLCSSTEKEVEESRGKADVDLRVTSEEFVRIMDERKRRKKDNKEKQSKGKETSFSIPEATPQDREASVPLMAGQQGPHSDDGDRTTAVMTVDQAEKRKEEAKAKAKEAKTKRTEAEKNAKMKANRNVAEIKNEAKEAKTRHEDAKKEVAEAKKALKSAKSKK